MITAVYPVFPDHKKIPEENNILYNPKINIYEKQNFRMATAIACSFLFPKIFFSEFYY